MIRFKGSENGILRGVELAANPGEILAIAGPNGSGKSLLCAILAGVAPAGPFGTLDTGDLPEDAAAIVQFAQQQLIAQMNGFRQARWHSGDLEFSQSAKDFLSFNSIFEINPFEVGRRRGAAKRRFKSLFAEVSAALDLAPLLPRHMPTLSNGETRRVLLARAILKSPRLLVLDDPMAGLDPAWRERVKSLIAKLAAGGIAIVAAIRSADETSGLENLRTIHLAGAAPRKEEPARQSETPPRVKRQKAKSRVPAIAIRNLTLAFGRKILFKNFSWTVMQGERWVVRGPNGSGKTTLFSLVTGDNPAAYACDIEVFGQRRKVGAELAKIRRRIAEVSPESQSYFPPGAIVNGRLFSELSSGGQRMALLERAISAKCDLLLLDEPCLNLDAPSTARFFARLDAVLRERPGLTAIAIAHRPDHIPPGFDKTLDLACASQL